MPDHDRDARPSAPARSRPRGETVKAFAARRGVSERVVWYAIKRGKLPILRLPHGRIRILTPERLPSAAAEPDPAV